MWNYKIAMATLRPSQCQDGDVVNEDARAKKDALENLNTRKGSLRRILIGILSKNSELKPNSSSKRSREWSSPRIAKGVAWNRHISRLPFKPPKSFKPRNTIKLFFCCCCCFVLFCFPLNLTWTREGQSARRKFPLNVLESQKKLSATQSPSFVFFKLVFSILWPFCCFYLMYASSVKVKASKY